MLKLVEKRRTPFLRRCPLTAGQRVSRKYRRANIRRIEYKKLKAIVPSIAAKNRVTKVEVIEEAIKYIDELHQALYSRVPLIYGNGLPPFLPDLSPQCALAQLLRRVAPPTQSASASNLTTTSQALSNTTNLNDFTSSVMYPGQGKRLLRQHNEMCLPHTSRQQSRHTPQYGAMSPAEILYINNASRARPMMQSKTLANGTRFL